jgi:lysophospholipase L1-like esterase
MKQHRLLLLVSALTVSPVKAEEESIPGPFRLILPPSIPVLTDLESNLYFENSFLALNPANLAVDVICRRGTHQDHRWTWKASPDPDKRDVGSHPLTLELRNQENAIVARASTNLHVLSRTVDPESTSSKSILILGDSLTNASVYSGRVSELAKEDAYSLKLIGTRGPGAEAQPGGGDGSGNRHEGYGGWTAHRFATHYTGIARGGEYKKCGSPFFYKDEDGESPTLDFGRYCREFNGGNPPDFVTILLGCNDTFQATDETIEERIDLMFEHYETIVAMIHDLNPATKIGAILPMPPAATQNAFGKNYGSSQTRWQYRRNQHRLLERMMETFGNRENENLFLVPAWLNLDSVHGFPEEEQKAHAHSDTSIMRQNNGVHPSPEGYRQIGDSVYAWLRWVDTKE